MIAVLHLTADTPDFAERAQRALEVLAVRPGYLRGSLGRAIDDESWLLVTEWENVGSYRRALGNYDVRLQSVPLLATAEDRASAFEEVVEVAPGGASVVRPSDRGPSG